ncbi:MAG: sugar phosphate isomerase/epimerase [Clostridia bacterium]|nr:sugar phosphate isomerase/epimerase [Clostridia bacterium]
MHSKIAVYNPPHRDIDSYFDLIDITAEYGASALEGFCRYELSSPDVESAKRIREYSDSKGIFCPCLSVFADFSSGDANAQIEKLCRFADIAKILGSPYIHHTIIGECFQPERVLAKKEEFFELGIRVVRTVTDYAASVGVKTVYEDQGFIFNGVEGFGKFLDTVERDVGVVADMGNVFQAGDDIHAFIDAFGHKVCHVHIKDLDFYTEKPEEVSLPTLDGRYCIDTEIGTGGIDLCRAIEQLKNFGYKGYYAVEYSAPKGHLAAYKRGVERLGSWIDR